LVIHKPATRTHAEPFGFGHIHSQGSCKIKEKTMEDIKLTPSQQHMVDQTVATLRIEGMEPSEDDIEAFKIVAAGKKTVDEAIHDYLKEKNIKR